MIAALLFEKLLQRPGGLKPQPPPPKKETEEDDFKSF